MSTSEPILSEFLTKEELAAELRRNPRTLDRWEVLGVGPAADARRPSGALSASERGEMARGARTKMGRSMSTPDAARSATLIFRKK